MEQNIQLKDSFGNKLFPKSKTEVIQEEGYSPSLVMSQKAVTDAINSIDRQYSLFFNTFQWEAAHRWEGAGGRSYVSNGNSIATMDLQEIRRYKHGGIIRVYNDSETTYKLWMNWLAEPAAGVTRYNNVKYNESKQLPAHGYVDFDIPTGVVMFTFALENGSSISKYELNKLYILKTIRNQLDEVSIPLHDVPLEDIEIRNEISKYRSGNVNYIKLDSTQNTALRFFHFSDIHGDAKEMEYIVNLANKWHDDGTLDLVINSGDTCLGNDQDDYLWYHTLINKCNVDVLASVGNHDSFGDKNGNDQRLAYNNIIAPTVAKCSGAIQPDGASTSYIPCFYKDYGIRVISIYTTYKKTEQLDWLRTVLADAISNSKPVILVNHVPFSGGPNGIGKIYWNNLSNFLDDSPNSFTEPITWAWGYDTPIDNTFVEAVKEFIDNGGEFICWLSGHLHGDYFVDVKDHELYGYQPTINITSARAYYTPMIKIDGEYSRHSFNYVSVDTNNKTISIMRIGCHFGNYHRHRHVLIYSYREHRIIEEY